MSYLIQMNNTKTKNIFVYIRILDRNQETYENVTVIVDQIIYFFHVCGN